MATITGLEVRARELAPDDEIMTEWNDRILTVESVFLVHGEKVEVRCRDATGRRMLITGGWKLKACLVTRKTPDYAPELTSEELSGHVKIKRISTSATAG